MTSRLGNLILLGLSVVAFVIAGYLLIPACALAHFGGIWDVGCEEDADISLEEEILRLEERARELQAYNEDLEARIAAISCTAEEPLYIPGGLDEPGDLLPPGDGDRGSLPPDLPSEEDLGEPTDELPRDFASLEGCWDLESELEIRMEDSGESAPFPEWNVCFEEGSGGVGTQVMRSDDGAVCEGDITGAFNTEGALVLEESEDLVCDDGTTIFRRVTTCNLDDGGRASCEAVQPRTGGRGSFTLRRDG